MPHCRGLGRVLRCDFSQISLNSRMMTCFVSPNFCAWVSITRSVFELSATKPKSFSENESLVSADFYPGYPNRRLRFAIHSLTNTISTRLWSPPGTSRKFFHLFIGCHKDCYKFP